MTPPWGIGVWEPLKLGDVISEWPLTLTTLDTALPLDHFGFVRLLQYTVLEESTKNLIIILHFS